MNPRNLKPEHLKVWARENRSLAMTVCKAMAFAQLERERVDAYTTPIFVRYGFTDSDTGEVLTDPRRSYLSDDDARMAEYHAEVLRAHAAHGWTGDPEFCPALVAEDLQHQAEQLLLESLGNLCGGNRFDFCRSLELRAKALDLALSACLSKDFNTTDQTAKEP